MSFLSLIMQDTASINMFIGILIGLAVIAACLIAGTILYRQQKQRKALLREIQEKQVTLARQLQSLRAEKPPEKLDETFARVYRERVRNDPDLRETRGITGKPFDLKEVYAPILVSSKPKKKAAPPHRIHPHVVEENTSEENDLDPREVIKHHPYCVLLGEPGSGKTTLLKKLSLDAVDEEYQGQFDLPIFVDLYHFAKELMQNKTDVYHNNGKNAQTLLEYIARKQEGAYAFKAADIQSYLEKNLKDGRVLVLLDGLDETLLGESEQEANNSYKTVSRIILELATCYYRSAFVVTCRQAVYKTWGTIDQFAQNNKEGSSLRFNQFEINPLFTEEDFEECVRNFVKKRWSLMQASSLKENVDGLMIDDFMDELKTRDGLRVLASNPLFLESMAESYWNTNFIIVFPSDIAGIYEVMADDLLKDWDRIRDKNRFKEVSTSELKAFLAEVAWYSAYHSKFCPEEKLRDFAIRALPDSNISAIDTIEKELLACSGFLQKDGKDWRFSHNVWENYFAALAVMYETERQEDKIKLEQMLEKKDHTLWKEIIELYCAYTPNIVPLLYILVPERLRQGLPTLFADIPGREPLRESIFESNVVLAGKYSVDSITRESRSNEVRNYILQTLLPEELQKTPYALIREKIVKAIVKYASLNRYYSPFEAIRIEEFKKAGTARQIIQSLYEESVKNNAKSLPGDLYYLAQKQLQPGVQEHVLKLLRELGSLPVIFDLLTLDLFSDSPPRSLIVDVFGKFDYGEAALAPEDQKHLYTSLTRILEQESIDADLQGKIARMLGRVREPGLPAQLLFLLSNQQLKPGVRCSIAVALGLQGKQIPAVIGKLESLVQTDKRLDLRVYSALALLALGEAVDRRKFDWLSSFSEVSQALQPDILGTVEELQLKGLSSDLLEIIANTAFDIDVRVKAVVVLFKLTEGEEARDVAHRLPELLSIERVGKEEELWLAILACLAEWKALEQQKKEVSSYLRSLPWRRNQFSTKNVWAALTLARYVYGKIEVLPELLPLSIDKEVHALLRCHILRKLNTLLGDRKEVESNQVLRDICNQGFAEDLLTALLNYQEQEASFVDEPLAWYNDLIPDTYEADCIADLLSKVESILSDESQTFIRNKLCEKLRGELPRDDDSLRRYERVAAVLTQFAGQKEETAVPVILDIVERLKDLEKHLWQDTNKDQGGIAKNRDEGEVASILLDTLNTIQEYLEMGKPFLYRNQPGGEIQIDFKYSKNPSSQQREQTSLTL